MNVGLESMSYGFLLVLALGSGESSVMVREEVSYPPCHEACTHPPHGRS